MPDARLRDAAWLTPSCAPSSGAWRSTRAQEDEDAYVRGLHRAGDERVRLLALLGAPLARELLGLEPARGYARRDAGIEAFGREVVVRARLAIAEHLAKSFGRPHPEVRLLDETLAAARAWCECPCPRHAGLAGTKSDSTALQAYYAEQLERVKELRASRMRAPDDDRVEDLGLREATVPAARNALLLAAGILGVEPLRRALLAELLPWALAALEPLPPPPVRTGTALRRSREATKTTRRKATTRKKTTKKSR